MRNTKKAFTLVELIVVITILAILGTIAFISLQGYSSDARNSKRTADLGSIISKMTIEVTKGVSLLSFVGDSANAMTDNNIAGTGATTADYDAGAVNYLALDMKESEFQDPVDLPYVIGVTTKAGAKYQVSATIETGGGNPQAILKGNWISRTNLLQDIYPVTGTALGKVVTLTDSEDTNKVKVGDYVTVGGINTTIIKVSDSGIIITLAANVTAAIVNIKLAATDTASLIGSTALTSATAVTELSELYLPYKIN